MYVTYHAPGDTAKNLRYGDFILTRAQTDQGRWIRIGQALKYGFDSPAIEVNHMALSMGGFMLVEALMDGVQRTSLLNYEDNYYAVVHTGIDARDQIQMRWFIDSVLEAKTGYGYWHLVSIALSLMIPWRLFFGVSGTEICSGLGAEWLTRAGWIWDGPPAFTYPADVADQCGVNLPWFKGI